MKIEIIKSNTPINKIKAVNRFESSVQYNTAKPLNTYRPAYYRPIISFKAKSSDECFPSDIFGIPEKEFISQIEHFIAHPDEKDKMAEYVIREISKDTAAVEFLDIWKAQIPLIASRKFLVPTDSQNNNNLTTKAGKMITGISSNPAVKTFLEQDSQSEEIIKDKQTAETGLLSYKLFKMGISEQNPRTKACLLGAFILTSSAGWEEKSEEAKEVHNKQFLDATKELLRIGVIDPLKLMNMMSQDKTELSRNNLVNYNKWREGKPANQKQISSHSSGDETSDFITEEGTKLLGQSVKTLLDSGICTDKLNEFLGVLGLIFLSAKETREAQHLLEISAEAQKKSYGSDSPQIVPILDALARTQTENGEYIEARETYKDALQIRYKNNFDPVDIFNKERELYLVDKLAISDLQERNDTLNFDEQICLTGARRTRLEYEGGKFKGMIPQITYEVNELEEKLVDFACGDSFAAMPLEQRTAILSELASSLSSKLMPISHLLTPIKQAVQESSDTNHFLPVDLFVAVNDSENILEAVKTEYGNESHSELTVLEHQAINASNIDELKKAFELSRNINGSSSPDTCRLAFEVANTSKEKSDISTAIRLISAAANNKTNNNYLCQLHTAMAEEYMSEAIYSRKEPEVKMALSAVKAHYNEAVSRAVNYKSLSRIMSIMLKFIDTNPTVKYEYEKTDKGGEYNNFREETYTVVDKMATFDKQRTIEETIVLLEKNPGKYDLHKRMALNLLSSNLTKTFFVSRRKGQITDQIRQLEQQADFEQLE